MLEVLRLRSDSFPRALSSAVMAVPSKRCARSWRSCWPAAARCPCPTAAPPGSPFREFPDPETYEREVLLLAG